MDLSDDSFAWSDASADSDMAPEMDNSYETESNMKVHEGSVDNQKISRKRKRENSADLDVIEYCSQKTIKSEVESDLDMSRKKKKKKYSENYTSDDKKEDPFDPLENYLNYKVKLEQESIVESAPDKSKKKKKHSKKSESNEFDDIDTSSQINSEVHLDYTEEVTEKEIVKENAKKRRKSQMFLSNEFVNSDDDFQETKPKKHKKHKKEKKSKCNGEVSQNEISSIDCSTLNNHMIEDDPGTINGEEVNNLSKQSPQDNVQLISNSKTDKVPKLLDNLRFEDEDSADNDNKKDDINTTMHNLKNFCKANTNLSLINLTDQTNCFTKDDSVWIIKGPHDLDINYFKDKSIKLDSKGKLKFNREIYDTVIDNNLQKAAIMFFDKNKSYIKNVSLEGVINIHNRIPKAHIPEENVIFNHQPNFIPLPETKCRHPLFGVDYRKAMKIPASVAERLNDSATITTPLDSDRRKIKKHKKEKRKTEVDSESEMKPLELETPVISSKKKKKKKDKRIKSDPESADAWESEKTIEKNLFDF